MIAVCWFVIFGLLCCAAMAQEPPPPEPQAPPLVPAPPSPPVPPFTERDPAIPPALDPGIPAVRPPGEGEPVVPPGPPSLQIVVPPFARTISFVGNTVISSEELLRISGLRPGQLVDEDTIIEAAERIRDAYEERGYIAAVVDVDLPEPGRAGEVVFYIQEVRIAAISIEGLQRVREITVRRVLRFPPGEVYNRDQVMQDYARLQQLGVFEEIAFELRAAAPGQADLVWILRERERMNYVSFGGSYSPQDSVVGSAQVILGNLRGRAERLRVIASVGSIGARVGGEAEYFNPWIAPDNTSLLVNAFSVPRYRFSQRLSNVPATDRYFERRTGFRSAVSRAWRPLVTISPGLRYEFVDVVNLPENLFTDMTDQSGSVGLANLTTTWDRRDSALNPTAGSFAMGFVEGGAFNQDDNGVNAIGKAWADGRWYFPLRPRRPDPATGLPTRPVPVLAVRGLLGITGGRVPFFEQFFVGGIGDLPLRGYIEDRFWGRYALLANAEVRWPLLRNLAAVAFIDVGDAWGNDFQFDPTQVIDTDYAQHRGFSPRAGIGVGLRYGIASGLFRFDVGYGDALRTYLTAGQAF